VSEEGQNKMPALVYIITSAGDEFRKTRREKKITRSLLAITALLVVYSGASLAQEDANSIEYQATHPDLSGNNPHWLLDSGSQCWVFDAHPKPHESLKWSGACKDNLASGNGTLTWLLNGKFNLSIAGTRLLGVLLNGHAVVTYPNGTVYDGDFVDGEPRGHGTVKFPGDGTYVGQWPGQGIWITPTGNKCAGRANVHDANSFTVYHPCSS
jgi:MORN repeat